jgi:hypothetical protein
MYREKILGFLLVGSAVSLAGCAGAGTENASVEQQSSADPQKEAQAFVDAVYRLCVPAVESGNDFEELEIAGSGAFRPWKSGEQPLLGGSGPGHYRTEAGVVQVDLTDGDNCRVDAYGLPVKQVFDVVSASITQPSVGYALSDNQLDDKPRTFTRGFVKSDDGVEYRVFLGGNEPGAAGTRSRFSTLRASVRRVERKEK